MKITKGLFPFLMILLGMFLLAGCSKIDKTDVEAVITNELDLLKNLDSDAAQKYISYEELFPNTTVNNELSSEIKEVFSLFFKDFDYKIQNIDVDKDNTEAAASVKLTVIDAQTLSHDYASAQLKSDILAAADSNEIDEDNTSSSLEDRYTILRTLLKENSYTTNERDCTFTLKNTGTKDKPEWEIIRTTTLENDLVGGLMTYLADSNILSPEDTLTIYLNTLKSMNTDQLGNYLGVESLLNSSDSTKNSIAKALVKKVQECFDFTILSSEVENYSATVKAEIITFDSDAIMSSYESKLNDYLDSVDAVIDGADTRYEKSLELLLNEIENNTESVTSEADFHFTNDGVSWKLDEDGSTIGKAIFGSLTTSP